MQVKTRKVSLTFIMRSKWFARGVADRRAGLPFCAAYERANTGDQCLYEFGRQFGAYASASLDFKRGIHVNPVAVRVMDATSA